MYKRQFARRTGTLTFIGVDLDRGSERRTQRLIGDSNPLRVASSHLIRTLDLGCDPIALDDLTRAHIAARDHLVTVAKIAGGRGALSPVLGRAEGQPAYGCRVNERDWPVELDQRIAAVASAANPYEAALNVSGCAADYLVSSVTASRLYQIWAALQDWFELKPGEQADALAAMRRAASEWLPARDDPIACQAYLDHWQYDVLGYKRPSK